MTGHLVKAFRTNRSEQAECIAYLIDDLNQARPGWLNGVAGIMCIFILLIILFVVIALASGSSSRAGRQSAGNLKLVRGLTPPAKLMIGHSLTTSSGATTAMDDSKFRPKKWQVFDGTPPDENEFRPAPKIKHGRRVIDLNRPCFLTGRPMTVCNCTTCRRERRLVNDNSQ